MGGDRSAAGKKVALFVTGFGSFGGVPANPTELIAKELLARFPSGAEVAPNAPLASCAVVEVSGIGALQHIARVQALAAAQMAAGNAVVFLHCGVNAKAAGFALERTAYNRANFSGNADRRGWEPIDQPIEPEVPLEEKIHTSLPVDILLAMVASTGLPAAISDDPGRYVCNWIFYNSLRASQSLQSAFGGGSAATLFLHVPPVDVVPLSSQVDFVIALLKALAAVSF